MPNNTSNSTGDQSRSNGAFNAGPPMKPRRVSASRIACIGSGPRGQAACTACSSGAAIRLAKRSPKAAMSATRRWSRTTYDARATAKPTVSPNKVLMLCVVMTRLKISML